MAGQAGVGVPIRLVRNDGELIYLNAESVVMTVDRKVSSIPMWFTGNTRLGIDFNRANAAIVITGILVDDAIDRTTEGVPAFCDIDFAVNAAKKSWFDAATFAAGTHFIRFTLLDRDGNTHKFQLNSSSVLGSVGSSGGIADTCTIGTANATSPADIANAVLAGISQNTHPTGVAHKPGDYFSAGVVDSELASSQPGEDGVNSRIKIYHKSGLLVMLAGDFGGATPSFDGWVPSSTTGPYSVPYHRRWSRGKGASSGKSAGDKAMDFYGTFNNTNNGGIGLGNILPALGDALGWLGDLIGLDGSSTNHRDNKYGDYIIGIQIPYHSMVQATGGDDYVQRNFYMPTGPTYKSDEKGSEANDNAVDVEFDPLSSDGDYTGIKGMVQQFVVSYDAGETVYNYQMTFLPADWIL